MNCRLIIAFLFFAGKLLAQTPQDSVIIRGQVTDFNGAPISGCTVMWQNPSFNNSVEVLTDNQGHYTARIPKGKYQSMAGS
jgi:protocatechuate 3,4-dioxygenase beta subunit